MRPLLAAILLVTPAFAHADEITATHPYFQNEFYASVGLFVTDQVVKLSLDASVELPEPELQEKYDFSETFGARNSDQTFSAEIGWRFGENWQLRGQYFQVGDNTGVELEEDVEWGDYVFNVGSSVQAGVDMQITRLFFGRTFRSADNREFGLGVGGHFLDLSAYVGGNAVLNGEDVGFVRERASISQPLPNIGGWYMQGFSDKVALTLRLDWLAANIDNYDGRIVNAAASLGYAVADHFGIGLAYNYFEIDMNVKDSDWKGGIRTRFNGPYISLTGYW